MELPQHGNWRSNMLRWRGSWAPTGWLLILLGGTSLLGRLLLIPALVQPFATRAPVRPLASLGLLAFGIGVLALDRRRRVTLIAAVIGIAIGCIALLSLVTGTDLGLDNFLFPRLDTNRSPTKAPLYFRDEKILARRRKLGRRSQLKWW